MTLFVGLWTFFVNYTVFDDCIWPEPSLKPGIVVVPCNTTSPWLAIKLLSGLITNKDASYGDALCSAMWLLRCIIVVSACFTFYGVSHLINAVFTPLYVHLIQNEVPAGAE
jgi:Ca2+/Na+ antiporter